MPSGDGVGAVEEIVDIGLVHRLALSIRIEITVLAGCDGPFHVLRHPAVFLPVAAGILC